jgi:uncharacterized membrane protein
MPTDKRWMIIALAVSVALNLALLGFMAGRAATGRQSRVLSGTARAPRTAPGGTATGAARVVPRGTPDHAALLGLAATLTAEERVQLAEAMRQGHRGPRSAASLGAHR